METYLLVEAVNFESTVFDTNQISIVRGSSLLALTAIKTIARDLLNHPHQLIRSGASSGLFRLATGTDVRSLVTKIESVLQSRDETAPYGYLTFGLEWCESDSFDAACAILESKIRTKQMRSLSFQPDGYSATDICVDTGVRGSAGEFRMIEDSKLSMSDSAHARYTYGRTQRKEQYKADIEYQQAIDLLDWDFTPDLHALASDESMGKLHNKLAVIYADGNKFSHVRQPAGSPRDEHTEKTFDLHLGKQRRDFRVRLLQAMVDNTTCFPNATNKNELRIETLLWGGDDMLLVVPAWLGMAVLDHLINYPWQFNAQPLTHSAAVVFCNVKTPIARSCALAQQMVEMQKREQLTPHNSYDYIVLESIDYPTENYERYLRHRYGAALSLSRNAGIHAICKLANIRTQLDELINQSEISSRSVYTLANGIHSGLYPTNGRTPQWQTSVTQNKANLTPLAQIEHRYISMHRESSPEDTAQLIASVFLGFGCDEKNLEIDTCRAWCWLHLYELWHYLVPAPTEKTEAAL